MHRVLVLVLASTLFPVAVFAQAPGYQGSQGCVCHSSIRNTWRDTPHGRFITPADAAEALGTWPDTLLFTASGIGNDTAVVILSTSGPTARFQTGYGGPIYDIARFMGGNMSSQRYHVRIDSSYYFAPFTWNMAAYGDSVNGSWGSTSLTSWFDSNAGGVYAIPRTPALSSAYDNSCTGCHLTGLTLTASTPYVSAAVDTTIACEACHGGHGNHPGSQPGFNPTNDLPQWRKMESCWQCHQRGTSRTTGQHGWPWYEATNTQWNIQTNTDSLNTVLNMTPTSSQLWADGLTSKTSRMGRWEFWLTHVDYDNDGVNHPSMGMTCWTCHNPHANTGFKHLLMADPDDNSICTQCHTSLVNPANLQAHTHHTVDLPNGVSRCVNCHMAPTYPTAFTNANHSFRTVSPQRTLNYASGSGTVNACAVSCHRTGVGGAPQFGTTPDGNLSAWNDNADIVLAESLVAYYNVWWGVDDVDDDKTILPVAYELHPAYPNPFNPATTLAYDLPRPGHVKLDVYDVLGRRVATLVDCDMPAGSHTARWEADGVASGVYFARLTTDDFGSTRKMVLLR